MRNADNGFTDAKPEKLLFHQELEQFGTRAKQGNQTIDGCDLLPSCFKIGFNLDTFHCLGKQQLKATN